MGLKLSDQKFTIAKTRDVKTPTRGTPGSAGIDFYVPNDYPADLCSIYPGERYFIPCAHPNLCSPTCPPSRFRRWGTEEVCASALTPSK